MNAPAAASTVAIPGHRLVRRLPSAPECARYLARRDGDGQRVEVEVYTGLSAEERMTMVRDIGSIRAGAQRGIDPILDAFEWKAGVALVRSVDRGTSLERRIEKHGELPADEALALVIEVAGILRAASRRGLLHGDLDTGSILLRDGETVLADGFCRPVGRERLSLFDKTGLGFHPPLCVAPEVLTAPGRKTVGRDMYALGCVLFRLLAGHAPFRAATAYETMLMHAESAVPTLVRARLPGDAAQRLDETLRLLLAKKPAGRPDSYDDVLARLGGAHRVLLNAAPGSSAPRLWTLARGRVGGSEKRGRAKAASQRPADPIDRFLLTHPAEQPRRAGVFRGRPKLFLGAAAAAVLGAATLLGAAAWWTWPRAPMEKDAGSANAGFSAAASAPTSRGPRRGARERLSSERARIRLDRLIAAGDTAGARREIERIRREQHGTAAAEEAALRLREIARRESARQATRTRQSVRTALDLARRDGLTAAAGEVLDALVKTKRKRPEVARARETLQAVAKDRARKAAAHARALAKNGDYEGAKTVLERERARTFPRQGEALQAVQRELDAAREAARREDGQAAASRGILVREFLDALHAHVLLQRYAQAQRLCAGVSLGDRGLDRQAGYLQFWVGMEARMLATAGARLAGGEVIIRPGEILAKDHALAGRKDMRLVNIGPRRVVLRSPAGRTEVPRSQVTDAALWRALSRASPDDSDMAQLGLVSYALLRGLGESARASARRAVALDPTNAERIARFRKALDILEKAATADSD